MKRGTQACAVRRGLARRVHESVVRIGIGESRFLARHQYLSIIVDLDTPRVLHAADDRRAESSESISLSHARALWSRSNSRPHRA